MSEGGNLRQCLVRGAHHRLGVDVELLVDVGDLAGGAEAVHADEAAFEADVAVPARLNRRFYRDVERLISSAEAFLYAASAIILIRRIGRCLSESE